ncbi:MAG: DNA topology modulation protein [Peptoniphilaceae bacterium]|nr:DNA topology modulation protein [Peptoniphilaceae bacterium]MDY3738600.1 DNA topology modulation protein [Peptoniphilaceae bacterium]
MKKISIIGSGGSGKSTLAIELGRKLDIKVFHLNKIWWKDDKEHIKEEEFIEIQKDIIKNNDSFIFDGNYRNTLDLRISASDTIIFLDMPTTFNMSRSLKKIITTQNLKEEEKKDPDHTDKLNVKYIRRLANYNREERPEIIKKLKKIKLEKRVVILDNEKKIELFLESIDKYSNH